MRIVIYDDETMEPITVVKLRGIGERDIELHGRRYRVPVPEVCPSYSVVAEPPATSEIKVVDLFFEQLVRQTPRGVQRTWMCFTKQDELAMLLKPDWLPGQRPTLEYLQEQNDRLSDMLLRVIAG